MSAHFPPFFKDWAQGVRAWCMNLQWIEGRPRTDYLLGMDFPLFQNVSVWEPQHKYDHYMVLGCLRSAAHKENHRYLGKLRWSPLGFLSKKIWKDRCFGDLHLDTRKPLPRERRGNEWIYAETWRLITTRVALRRELQIYQRLT